MRLPQPDTTVALARKHRRRRRTRAARPREPASADVVRAPSSGVQSALQLAGALPATGARVFALGNGLRARPAPDRAVALVVQRVTKKLAVVLVLAHVELVPRGDGVDLYHAAA